MNASNRDKGRSAMSFGRVLGSVVGLAAFVLFWFLLAGRLDWVQGWAFMGFFLLFVTLLLWRLYRVDPALMVERQGPAETAEPWDRALMTVYSVVLLLLLALAALDSGRYRWSAVPLGVQLLGWGLLALASAIIWHVMTVNAYLSSWARLQPDRGQVVVDRGLYGRVRHPMYLGIILFFGGLPLLLASWWALIPAGVIVAIFVLRTAREDRMLHGGLPGYPEYAQRVRYRLIPGLW